MGSYGQRFPQSGTQASVRYSRALRKSGASSYKIYTYQSFQSEGNLRIGSTRKSLSDRALSYQAYTIAQPARSKSRTIQSRLVHEKPPASFPLAPSLEEIDSIADEPLRSYAKRALVAGGAVTNLLPRIAKSPEGGVALQTSTENGTLNLIIEGEQGILIRVGDEVVLQMTCHLSDSGIAELLDTYLTELKRVVEG